MVADCQYARPGTTCDHPKRRYAESCRKLRNAVDTFNRVDLAFVVSLGDLIEQSSEDLAPVLEVLDSCEAPVLHVLGNHDLVGFDGDLSAAAVALGMPAPYYSHEVGGVRIVVLDTNRCGVLDVPRSSSAWQRGAAQLERRRAAGEANARPWNGGVDAAQLRWLAAQLASATAEGQPVVVFAHQPVHPMGVHNVLNSDQVLEVLQASGSVAGYFNGHNHAGGLAILDGRPFLTLTGMVDTTRNAFAVVDMHDSTFEVTGHGREPSRRLPFTVDG